MAIVPEQKGKVMSFDPHNGRGIILSTFREASIPFSVIDCSKRLRKRLDDGEMPQVYFQSNSDTEVKQIAINIRLVPTTSISRARKKTYGQSHIDRVVEKKLKKDFPGEKRVSPLSRFPLAVRYNYEHWEEVERAIDGDSESTNRESNSILVSPIEATSQADYLALGIFKDNIRLVRLAADGRYSFVDAKTETHRILYPSVFPDLSLSWAIQEFEDLLNSKTARELDFQRFFEKHPEFILGDEFRYAHPHITLTSSEGSQLIPDFLLQPINQMSFCDILDIKLPSSKLFVFQKNRNRYSAAVLEAAAQLRTYSSFFDDKENSLRFSLQYPHLNVYKPRMFVIIGRDNPEMLREKQLIKSTLPELNLTTFDELLERMRWRKEQLSKSSPLVGL